MSSRHKIIIVGGGPGGLSTALSLAQEAPELAAQTLILEAKEHPRPKICGGGVTYHGEEQLERMGVSLDVPSFYIHRITFRLGKHSFTLHQKNAMRIIHRADFDAALAEAVNERGIQLHTGERLRDLTIGADGVTLVTNRGQYHADVVIGADGANSLVRRRLNLKSTLGVARLLRNMAPIDPETSPGWQRHEVVFDFSHAGQGIQGYVWDFPCYIDGKPYMNRGIFDSRIDPQPRTRHQHFKRTFEAELDERGVDRSTIPLEGHPVRWFNPRAEFSRPRVLLVGDAAGVDPLFAEGISYAMEYGDIAAKLLKEAFARGDFSFTSYRERLLDHKLGRSLKRRTAVARLMYKHHLSAAWSVFWRLADISSPAMKRFVGASIDVLPTT